MAGGKVGVLQHDLELGKGFGAGIVSLLLRSAALALLLRRRVAGGQRRAERHAFGLSLLRVDALLVLHAGPAQAIEGDCHVLLLGWYETR